MILDTDNAGNLIVKANGQDGAIVLTMKDDRQVRCEERDGQIRATEETAQDHVLGMGDVHNN